MDAAGCRHRPEASTRPAMPSFVRSSATTALVSDCPRRPRARV